MTEYFNCYFQENDHACPTFFPGTFEQAVKEAFQGTSIEDVRLPVSFSRDRSLNSSSAVHSTFLCGDLLERKAD